MASSFHKVADSSLYRPHPNTVRAVCSRLQRTYGSPRLGNPTNPLSDLVFILVSNRTGPAVAKRVYRQLRSGFRKWSDLEGASASSLRRVLKPAGLAGKRARQLKEIVRRLRQDFGCVSLNALAHRTDSEAEHYLVSLPGVSRKVAKCVLLYGFGREVLPVDVHVHRVASRLGWHSHRRADQSHDTLESLVPPQLRYGFHTNAVAHGRAICRPVPACPICPLLEVCPTGQRLVST